MPIFHGVSPSDVRNQKGPYASAFAEHEKRFEDTKVNKWRAALTAAANLSGWDSSVIGPESTLIEKIVDDILKKLSLLSASEDLSHLVGTEKRIKQIEHRLDTVSQESRTIGIWGMGGIGKTVLARILYARLCSQFESCCFLANVREESKKYGLDYVEKKLFAELLKEKNDPDVVNSLSKTRLRRKKVLIVLDDVNELEQLERLVGDDDRFGNGSRIIITSRDRDLLPREEDKIYKVEPLDFDESHQLFINNAFWKDSTTMVPDYSGLIERVINYVGGIPLACKVLGSVLRGKNFAKWEIILNDLKQVPNKRIEKILRKSYDELDEKEKQIFLDIACIFKGEKLDLVSKILEGHGSLIRMEQLIGKCLITIKDGNQVWMHDLLQEMGMNIVRQESTFSERRSRLWDAEDICHILENDEGTEAIQGISLDVCQAREMSLSPTVFQKMRNLRLLHIYNSEDIRNCKMSFPQGLQMDRNALWSLCWDAYPLSYLPSNFTVQNLVQLKMAHSQLKELRNDVMNFSKLSILDLSWSKRLTEIPDLSKASDLETLILQYCDSLLEVPSGIQHLEKLRSLNVEFCPLIKELPELPKNIECLKLSGTAIKELPSSVGLLCNLKELHVSNCESLISLPDNIHKLISLQYLDLSNCSKLEKLPKIMEPMNLLMILQLNKTAIKVIPASWIEHLVGLEFLNLDMCKNLERIPTSIQNMTFLQGISIRGCSKLKNFEKIPLCLSYLDAHGCTSLENVPSSGVIPGEDQDKYQLLGGRFVFYGCLKLSQSIFNIMASMALKILRRAITLSTLKRDRTVETASFSVCHPGNQIPNFFKYQSEGSSISIKPRQDWLSSDFLGFVLCAVVDSTKDSSDSDGDLNLVCRLSCTTDNDDRLSWDKMSIWGDKLPSLGCGRWGFCRDFNWGSGRGDHDQIDNSSHVFFWDDYSHRTLVNNIKDKHEMNPSGTSYNLTQATFEFFCMDKNYVPLEGRSVEKCGVHLLYRQRQPRLSRL